MASNTERLTAGDKDLPDSLRYLARRVRQEAEAAVRASSVASTSIHVILATAYAKRFGESSARRESSKAEAWIDENRVW